ncbi:ABC transporter ATP-binding protein [Lentilactobacillus sp. IMAU92037]|uniref:ABC transporter ATP-binding protein n=1 Tax=Lentilactobacillus dabitei TaxID=2831523 RepID=UPI001C26401F|nr:ABC transporter ATP-binding protein [Lentilactobacillus dabitei]MBU9788155.1 ABC transporter ATP-binding protein [Lentilactobacillus dabitei]MBV0929527.1 ABC transporter ATP-binding protein [Lentilactobacillus dabitei]
MNQQVISIQNITKTVTTGGKEKNLEILHGVSLTANQGEFLSIVGPSGSGKSTLLHCMSGLSKPTSGSVTILGVDPYKLRPAKSAIFRRTQVGFIFQSYNLIPALPAFDNIVLPLRLSRKKVDKQKIDQLLKDINFNADPANFVTALSGGERQKVAIARVLVSNCRVIFADEPTGALDSVSGKIIFGLLRDLTKQGVCVVMVTHDIEMAAHTDRAITLRDGQLRQILDKPNAQELFEALNAEKK